MSDSLCKHGGLFCDCLEYKCNEASKRYDAIDFVLSPGYQKLLAERDAALTVLRDWVSMVDHVKICAAPNCTLCAKSLERCSDRARALLAKAGGEKEGNG